MPTLPPIPQDTWDEHVTSQTDKAVSDGFAALDSARAAQDQARQAEQIATAREQEDAAQRAQAQLDAVLQPARDAQATAIGTQQARGQLDSILAPARAAQQQAQQAAAAPTGPSGSASGPQDGTSAPLRANDTPPTDVGGTDWRAYAAQAAQRAGIDPALFQRQIQQESGFDPNARSGAGAQGIAQIVPSAHPGVNPLDPKASLDYAANWMRQLTDRYGGDARKALAAYNAGPGAVDKYGGVPPFEETQRYVRTIYDEGGQASPLGPPATPGTDSATLGRTRPPGRVEAVGQFEQGLPAEPSAPNERDAIRQRAEGYLGTPYLWGGADKQGIDCSAFISRAWGVPRQTTDTLARVANPIAKDDLQPGDALNLTTQQDPRGYGHVRMFDGWADPDHTTMYVYESSTATGGVARRVIPYDQAYQPMRLGTLTGEPPARTQARMHVDAPPIEAEQAQPGRPTTTPIVPEGDRPPSEFEQPSQFQGDRYLGRRPDQPITMGDVGEPTIATGLPRTPLEAARTGATAIGNQIADTARYRQETDDLTLKDIASRRGGPPLTPDEQEQLRQANLDLAMSLTPEPIAQAGGKVAGKVAAKIVPGLLDAAGNPIRAAAGEVAPILDELGNVLKEVRVRAPAGGVTRPEFLQPEAKIAPTQVPLYRQVFDRTRNVIGSMGQAGQELAQRVHDWREGAETDAAAYLQRMPTVDKLGSSDFTNMVDALEGNARPRNPRIEQAAAEAKGVLDDLFSRAENAGVDVAERIGNYFPHQYKEDVVSRLADTKKRAEAIRHLMDTGQAGDEAEAIDRLSRFAQTSRNRRHGSLEMERAANLPGYEKTKEALYNHILSASRRVNEVAQFGRGDAIKDRLVTRMTAEGYEGDLANDMFKTIVGAKTYSQAAEDISRVARTWHTATRLGLSAISNATQSVNTASVTGVVKTLQAMPKAAWSLVEKEFAAKTGVTLDSIVKEVREGAGWSDRIPGLLLPGFNQVETFNRRVAAIAGRDFARDMATQATNKSNQAARALKTMGLDVDAIVRRGGTLTPEEEVKAARSIVERTQFRVDPQDLPQWASHPIGKMAAQFKTFAMNQSAFLKRELIDEARKGNVLPMVRFAILAPIAQAAATETRNALSGRAPEEDPGMRALQYALGPLGLVGDVSRTLFGINSKYVPIERRTAQFVGSLLGPTAGTVTEGLGAGLNVLEGKTEPAVRLGLRQVPIVGGILANKLTPYKSQEEPLPATPGRNRDGSRTTRERSRSGGR